MRSGWELARAQFEALCAAHADKFAQSTIENASALLTSLAEASPAPDAVSMGYWPTVRFSWTSHPRPIEIEVFEDRFEFYAFSQGATEIRYFPSEVGKRIARG